MKILSILKNLNKVQSSSLDLFMQSPFFRIEKDCQQLYKILAPYLKKGTIETVDQSSIFTTYNNRYHPLSSAQFNKLTFRFRGVIEQFLAHQAFSANEQQKSLEVIKSYAQFPEFSHYTKAYQQQLTQMDKSTIKNNSYYLHLAQLQNDLYFHPTTSKKEKDAGLLLNAAQKDLDQFYLLSKLQIAVELLYRNKTMTETHDIALLDQLLAVAKEQTSPVFDIYLNLVTLLREDHQTAVFLNIKSSFETHISSLDKKTKTSILTILLNEANIQYNNNQPDYLSHLFQLYQLGVQHKLFLDNTGQLSDLVFINIIILCCLAEDFEYAYSFIQRNQKYLSSTSRENAVNFSWAYLYFHTGEFEKSWSILLNTTFTTMDYKIRYRSLLVRCFYEQSIADESIQKKLLTELKNFRKFIYRLNASYESNKQMYYNQITVIRALTEFNPALEKKKDFQKKWTTFLTENSAMTKKWLLEKLKEIK